MIRDYHHVTLVSSVIRHTCHTLYYTYIARPSAWRSDLVIPIHDHMIFFSARSLFDLSYSLIVVPHFSHTRCAVKLDRLWFMVHENFQYSIRMISVICMIGRLGHQNGGSQVALLGQIMIELIQPLWYFGFGKKLIKNWIDDEILVEFGRGFWFWLIRILVQMTAQFLIEIASLFFSSKKPFWRVSFEHFNILVAVARLREVRDSLTESVIRKFLQKSSHEAVITVFI